jgi:hypothetical protein
MKKKKKKKKKEINKFYTFYLSLMMALSERYANAWHMLIERQYLIFKIIYIEVVYRWVIGIMAT